MPNIRRERADDRAQVRRVNELAFGRRSEADLIDALRDRGKALLSLVAETENGVVGHILFSPVSVESEGDAFTAVGLGPMAVLPELQGREIGSALVRAGLEECRREGHRVVFVLGHPKYYPRFGFVPSRQLGLSYEHPVPDEVFLVAELEPGALGGRTGLVRYAPEFENV